MVMFIRLNWLKKIGFTCIGVECRLKYVRIGLRIIALTYGKMWVRYKQTVKFESTKRRQLTFAHLKMWDGPLDYQRLCDSFGNVRKSNQLGQARVAVSHETGMTLLSALNGQPLTVPCPNFSTHHCVQAYFGRIELVKTVALNISVLIFTFVTN